MSQKIAKLLRSDAKLAMKYGLKTSSENRVEDVLRLTSFLGVSQKMGRRATRLAANYVGKKVPEWAKRKLGKRGMHGFLD